MHELGVVFHIIDSLEEVAKENDVTQIQSVTIEIGEVSTVIPHYLTGVTAASRNTPLCSTVASAHIVAVRRPGF